MDIKSKIFSLHKPWVAWIVLSVSLALTIGAYVISNHFAEQLARARFESRTEEISNAIKERMAMYEEMLRGGLAHIYSADKPSRKSWEKYIETLDINKVWPGIQGVGYAVPVTPENKANFEATVRSEGFPNFLIKPEGIRDYYSAILYLEPFDWRNQRAFGYDMWSNETRRAAMSAARDSGQTVMSGMVTLVQETDKDIQKGFLLYLPAYKTKKVPPTNEERISNFIGWVYAPFRVGDLMRGVLGSEDNSISFKIYDGEMINQENLLYDSNGSTLKNTGHRNHFIIARKVTLPLYHRIWTISFEEPGSSIYANEKHLPQIVAVSGIVIEIILFYIIFSMHHMGKQTQKRAEELAKNILDERKNADNKFRLVVESSPSGLIMINSERQIVMVNDRMKALFGYSGEELLGREVEMLLPHQFRKDHVTNVQNYFKMPIPRAMGTGRDLFGIRKDGSQIPVEIGLSPLKTDDGLFILASIIDITERKKAEEKIRLFNDRFELAKQAAGIGVWDWDITKDNLIWDDKMYELYNLSKESFRNIYEAWEMRIHHDDLQTTRQAINDALTGKRDFHTQFRVVWADRSVHYIQAYGKVQRDNNGNAVRMTGVNWDISQTKAVETMKNEFISTVSHELRTPLTSIRGSLGLIADGATGPIADKTAKMVNIGLSNCERLIRLINDILDIEKIESGNMQFNFEPSNLTQLIEKAIDINTGLADQYRVKLKYERFNAVFVNADRDKILQVLTNLISNAVKYSPENSYVELSIIPENGFAKVSISDRGRGIPPEFKSRVFQKFSQVDSSDARQKGGTGLGLSICKAIVENHGGTIDYESAINNGTTFYFYLPLIDSEV